MVKKDGNALQLLAIRLPAWLNGNQQLVIDYLEEEAKVLREQLSKKPRFTEDQRRKSAIFRLCRVEQRCLKL